MASVNFRFQGMAQVLRVHRPVVSLELGDFDGLNHYALALSYVEWFGRANIFIIPFEWLKQDWNRFVDTISDIVCMDAKESRCLLRDKHENPGHTERLFWKRDLRLKSRIGHKLYELLLHAARAAIAPPERAIAESLEIPPDWRERFELRFADDYRRLMAEWRDQMHRFEIRFRIHTGRRRITRIEDHENPAHKHRPPSLTKAQ